MRCSNNATLQTEEPVNTLGSSPHTVSLSGVQRSKSLQSDWRQLADIAQSISIHPSPVFFSLSLSLVAAHEGSQDLLPRTFYRHDDRCVTSAAHASLVMFGTMS